MRIKAYCKVNLGLQVVQTLDNGYHDLDMIMMPLEFFDTLDITKNTKNSDHFSSNFGGAHFAKDNSVLKSIELFRQATGIRDTFDVRLFKLVPSQAGLGGGSGDAAATLKLLNKMYGRPLSFQQLLDIGVNVGADVPYCLTLKPARVKGIGEQIQSFQSKLDCWIILCKPDKGVSTKKCFELCEDSHNEHINNELEFAIRYGDYKRTMALLNNSLEAPAMQLVPAIASIKQELLDYGCDGALMSGSGSCVMGFVRSKSIAQEIAKKMHHSGRFVRVTRFLKLNGTNGD